MKKILLRSAFAAFAVFAAFFVACNDETVVPATPPEDYWAEAIMVPIKEATDTVTHRKLMSYAEMLEAHEQKLINLDTFKYDVREILFIAESGDKKSGILQMTIHQGAGQEVDTNSTEACPVRRTEYVQIRYTIESSAKGEDVSRIVWTDGDGKYTGAAFGDSESEDSKCSNTGLFKGFFEYSYYDTEPKCMILSYYVTVTAENGEEQIMHSSYVFEKRQRP